MEYRSASGVGPFTSLFRCCIDGGLVCDLLPCLSAIWTFVRPDFGFVARRLFSCSSLARSKVVD
jgi:hypothetical protein